jgi:hypothetical protein
MFMILSRRRTSGPIWARGRLDLCRIGASRDEHAKLKGLWVSLRTVVRRRAPALRWFRGGRSPVDSRARRSVLVRAASSIRTSFLNSLVLAPHRKRSGVRLLRCLGVLLTIGFLVAPSNLFAQSSPRIDRSVEADAKKLVTPETQVAIDRGLAFLAARQSSRDGSFGSSASARRRVAITALAGMAFLSSGNTPGRGKYGTNVQKAVDFLLTRCQPNGFIYDESNTGGHFGPMYDHGFATLFLGEVYGMVRTPQVRVCLERAVQLIVNSQNKEGGWRYEPDSKDADLSVTVCEIMALRAARNSGIYVPKQTIDRCTDYVRKCQTAEGGFRYQLTTSWQAVTFGLTAAGVVTLYSAGVYEGKPIEQGLQYLERYRPSAVLHQPANHYFYSHYYAAQAMWHAGGSRFEQWYSEIRDELVHGPFPFRASGGGWRDPSSYGDDYGTAMALIILQTPNNYLPIFQR